MVNPSDVNGIMVCPDGHRCENYSICVENTEDEGNYYCDCDASTVNSAFKGLYCEHEATTFCTDDSAMSRRSFCTNGGTCIAIVGEDSAHLGCDCPADYEGSHCQFVKGTRPDNWGGDPNTGREYSNDGGGMEGGAIAAIVLVVLAVIGGAALYARRTHVRSKQQGKAEEVEVGGGAGTVETDSGGAHSLQLEADGGVLQEAVASSQTNMDAMANEEDEGTEGEIL